MVKTKEDFLPDVGGFLDGIPGDVTEAIFEIASGKYADQVALGGDGKKPPIVLTITVDSPDRDKPILQSYSVGDQSLWDIAPDGSFITNVKNPDKHTFRDGSMAMELVKGYAEAIGDGDMEKGQEYFAKRDFYMTEAAFYIGLSFDWAVKTITRVIAGKSVTSKPPVPEKFLGETAGIVRAGGSASAGNTKASDATEVDVAALDKIITDNAGGKTDRELKAFAVENAEIKANDGYMKSIVSGKHLTELETSGGLTKDPSNGTYI